MWDERWSMNWYLMVAPLIHQPALTWLFTSTWTQRSSHRHIKTSFTLFTPQCLLHQVCYWLPVPPSVWGHRVVVLTHIKLQSCWRKACFTGSSWTMTVKGKKIERLPSVYLPLCIHSYGSPGLAFVLESGFWYSHSENDALKSISHHSGTFHCVW